MLRLCFPLFYKGKYIPVGRRVFRETLVKGRKQKSPIILLPPYITVHELRLMLNISYDVCFKAANVYKCGNKYTWRDSENRVFQSVNKRNVIIPYSTAAYVSKIFHFKPKLIEVELTCQEEKQQSENMSLSDIYKRVYTFEQEFSKKGKIHFSNTEKKQHFAVVSVIGHIDHGKTTLLDKITNSNLALSEAGCITQNIKVIHFEKDRENQPKKETGKKKKEQAEKHVEEKKKSQPLEEQFQYRFTFLDTPGHEVFQIFRGRAAFLSDILIILISLEVGAEVQTKEAIQYADKFDLPVIFAFNKFDIYFANEAVVRAELKNQCQKMFDEGTLRRDYSEEIEKAICISSLTGYNVDLLLNRLFFFSKVIDLPYHSVNEFYNSDFSKKDMFSTDNQNKNNNFFPLEETIKTTQKKNVEEKKWENNHSVLQKYIRKSDCLLALDCQPLGTGIVIDIYKDSTRGTLLNIVIRNGFFMEGSFFICGSAYGKIQKMYKHNTNFKEHCTYATVGMSVQISGIKKYGNATTDDIIFILPQNNAFRLCQYRLMVEKLCSLQTSGKEIKVSWENDMKQNEFHAEEIYKNRMQMTRNRKAIEEFGVPHSSSNEDTIFKQTSLEDFYKSNTQLRKEDNLVEIELQEEKETDAQRYREKQERMKNIISASKSAESILVSEDETDDALVFFDYPQKNTSLLEEYCNGESNSIHKKNLMELECLNENGLATAGTVQIGKIEENDKNEKLTMKTNITNEEERNDTIRQNKDEHVKYYSHITMNSMEQEGALSRMQHLENEEDEENEKTQSARITKDASPLLLERKNKKYKYYNSNVKWEEEQMGTSPVLLGRRNKKYKYSNANAKWEGEQMDTSTEKENEELKEPWYYEGSEQRWAEKVLKRNEDLTETWRGKTRQREIEKERQKFYEKQMILQNEIKKRNLLGEEKLTDEEIYQYLHEKTPNEETVEPLSASEEEFQLPQKNCPVIPIIIRTNYVGMFDIFLDEFEKLQKEHNVKIAVVHGGVGPITPNDVVHAEVESEFGYCCIYAFQVQILPDSVKQALLSKIVIKQFDLFTDLIDDVVSRIKNIKTLIKHNMYVRSLKTQK